MARWLPDGTIDFLGRIDHQVRCKKQPCQDMPKLSCRHSHAVHFWACVYAQAVGWRVQVKLRGFRIELGEVEAAMADVPGVVLAAALVLKDPSGSQQLVGYVTPESVDPAAVLESLKARLPAHFVPLLVMPLRQMPLTPADKVDRKALETKEEFPAGLVSGREVRRVCRAQH